MASRGQRFSGRMRHACGSGPTGTRPFRDCTSHDAWFAECQRRDQVEAHRRAMERDASLVKAMPDAAYEGAA